MLSIIKYSFRSLLRRRFRAFLTVCGIAIGVMSVVVISSIGNMGKLMINEEMDSIGLSGLSITASVNNTSCNLTENDLIAIDNKDYVKNATPLSIYTAKSKLCGVQNECIAWGISDNVQSIISLKLMHGRMVSLGDIQQQSKVCVVDEQFARANFLRSNIVGKTVDIMLNNSYEKYLVVGVVSTGGSILKNFIGDVISSFVYLPYTTIENEVGVKGFNRIALTLKDDANTNRVTDNIEQSLTQLDKTKAITVENMAVQKDKLNNILNIVTIVLGVIAAVSLVVSGLSIMTVMLVSINERTREIGIKKSIGAGKNVILTEFLAEALIMSIIGGVIGSVLGLAALWVGCLILNISVIIELNTVLLSIAFAVVVGVLFGVYPALKASNLKPALAIRYE